MKFYVKLLAISICFSMLAMEEEIGRGRLPSIGHAEGASGMEMGFLNQNASSTVEFANNEDVVLDLTQLDERAPQILHETELFKILADGQVIFKDHISEIQKDTIQTGLLTNEHFYIDEEAGRLMMKRTRFDFSKVMESVQSIAKIFSEIGHLKDLWSGANKKLSEADRKIAAANAAREADRSRLVKTWLVGAGGFVVTVTPSVIAIVKAFQQ